MKVIARTVTTVALTATILGLCACSKHDAPPAPTSATSLPQNQNSAANSSPPALSVALPVADKTTPDNQYVELENGSQLLFMYYGLLNMPVDYEKIAREYSRDYSIENDGFKKRDMLNALKPRIDTEIQRAKSMRYFKANYDARIDHYDFNSHSFPIPENFVSGGSRFFMNDHSDYQYTFTNGDSFNKIDIVDESKAKEIEKMIGQYPSMQFEFYIFAQDVDPSSHLIKCQLVKMELRDSHHNVLAVQQ